MLPIGNLIGKIIVMTKVENSNFSTLSIPISSIFKDPREQRVDTRRTQHGAGMSDNYQYSMV